LNYFSLKQAKTSGIQLKGSQLTNSNEHNNSKLLLESWVILSMMVMVLC